LAWKIGGRRRPKYDDLWAAISEEEEDLKKPSNRQRWKEPLAEFRADQSGAPRAS